MYFDINVEILWSQLRMHTLKVFAWFLHAYFLSSCCLARSSPQNIILISTDRSLVLSIRKECSSFIHGETHESKYAVSQNVTQYSMTWRNTHTLVFYSPWHCRAHCLVSVKGRGGEIAAGTLMIICVPLLAEFIYLQWDLRKKIMIPCVCRSWQYCIVGVVSK